MKRLTITVIVGSLALLGCGDDDDGGGGDVQAELADLLVQDAEGDVDATCLREKTNRLSDDQAQFVIENIDAESTNGFDADLQAWAAGLIECWSDTSSASGNRELFNDEVDGVRAAVADCFVVEGVDGSLRYQTTIEVRNGSDAAQTVTVTIDADLGRGGSSDSFEVPAGASDAFAVTADEETTDEVGDVECADYINGIDINLDPPTG